MIVTFYSYKGGVGRSMALANVAVWFRLQGLKVVMIDWDLEAPGLESFFAADSTERDTLRAKVGLVDLITMYKDIFPSLPRPMTSDSAGAPAGNRNSLSQFVETLNDTLPPIAHTLIPLRVPSKAENGKLSLLSAGCRSESRFDSYAQAVQRFDWEEFYAKFEGETYFEWMRRQLLHPDVADIVLIDSRTGVAEMSGVCTRQLADVVVMLCAPNDQNLEGMEAMGRSFTRPDVLRARGGRPIELLPVPARVDVSEGRPVDLFEERFRKKLEPFMPAMFRRFPASANRLRIPYIREYAYAEQLAIGDPEGVKSLQQAYVTLAAHVVALSAADSAIKRQCRAALQETFGLPTVFVTGLDGDGSGFASELRLRLDRAGVIALYSSDKPEATLEAAQGASNNPADSRAIVLAVPPDRLTDTRLRDLSRRAREQGVSLLVVTDQRATGSAERPRWARRLAIYDLAKDWDELARVLQSPVHAPRIPFMAPPVRPGFVGRTAEIQSLKTLLLSDETRARSVAIVGLGGMGKSALARALCNDDEVIDAFEDGILWMTLGAEANVLKATKGVLAAFGEDLSRVAHLEDAERRLTEHLSSKRCLIVVDDVTDSGHLRLIASAGPDCRVLITTRARDVAAEADAVVFEALPLSTADARAWIARKDVNPELAEALATKLGNLPLALELADQALRRGMSVVDLVQRLDEEGLTAVDTGTSGDAGTSLFSSLMLAVERLPHDDRARLPSLAVLPAHQPIGMTTLEGATGLSSADAYAMAKRLAATSLISFDPVEGTVTIAEPVHGFLRSLQLRQNRAEAVRRASPRPTDGSIGISYRREDSSGYAGRIYDRFSDRFGFDRVFVDIDSIPAGMDFVDAIQDRIMRTSALLVVMGPNWTEARDGRGGRRLDDPGDFVRVEIEVALKREIPVIPVLVGDAAMPRGDQLPASLQPLVRRQAIALSDLRFHQDVDQLIDAVNRLSFISRTAETYSPAPPEHEILGKDAPASVGDADRQVAWRSGEPIHRRRRALLAGSVAAAVLLAVGAFRLTGSIGQGSTSSNSSARALFEQAEAYYFGRGVSQDYAEAARLYLQAANLGFAPAQNGLGRMYENGLGVSKDMERAIQWYRLAAGEGHPDAQAALARLGVPIKQ